MSGNLGFRFRSRSAVCSTQAGGGGSTMLNFSDSECTRTLLHALQISSFSSQYLLTFALDWQRSEMRSNTDVDRRTFGRRHEREHCASAFTVIRLRLASAPAYLAAAWDWCNAAFKRCAAEGVAEAKGLQMACLRGALVDLVDLRVAHQLLNRVFSVEAVAAKNLHGVGADFVAVVTGEALGHRRVERVAPAVVDLVRSLDGTTSTGARVYLWGDELTRADGRNNIEHKSERVALRA
mmetsp:Transcript_17461/g.37551  ORF Transcript_17461/g.37551 Transcript_17461/m.37551 type:complete len:237 (+) Transcript_17461:479-1189(+)